MQIVHAPELRHHSNLVMEDKVGAMREEEQEVNPSLPLEVESIQEEEIMVEEEDILVEEFQTPTHVLLLQVQHNQITKKPIPLCMWQQLNNSTTRQRELQTKQPQHQQLVM
eukprot:9473130-Ditylum_brightwellii.AAC.1